MSSQFPTVILLKGKVIIMFDYPPAPPAINSYGGEVNSVDEVRRARVDPCDSLIFFVFKVVKIS